MKKFIFFIVFHTAVFSQTAFHNYGDVRMHAGAEIGFHTHFVNDGDFDTNLGFTGFYSADEILTVSGNNRAIFNNVEIDVMNNLELYTAMGVSNELLFVNGKVITPRNHLSVSLDFINYNLYAGEDDERHVDGYTTILGFEQFVFPIGDDDRFRPMITPAQNENIYLKGAYFYEDPNTPSTFSSNFITSEKHYLIGTVSTYEFWDLNGDTETTVTLTWDGLSNVNLISPDINFLIVVGWNIEENKWESLGNSNMTGDFDAGTITSTSFIPNEYEIITLGSIGQVGNNYYISPNGDEVGDTLVFGELDVYPTSQLTIFNRWGNLVYSKENYQNDFDGTSDGRATIVKEKDLPVGTYFYELHYGETELTEFKQGWVYIHR